MRNEEHTLQRNFVDWFRWCYPRWRKLLVAVPNGGARNAITGAILKAEGATRGVADLILFIPNKYHHALCIEMKTRQGRQSPQQKEWQEAVEHMGYRYEVVRSLDEGMALVTRYLDAR